MQAEDGDYDARDFREDIEMLCNRLAEGGGGCAEHDKHGAEADNKGKSGNKHPAL